MAQLGRYAFPGNIRELENELERAILLADPGADLTEDLLSDHVQDGAGADAPASALDRRTADFQRKEIEEALKRADNVKTRAAEQLGITTRGLSKKMHRLGM